MEQISDGIYYWAAEQPEADIVVLLHSSQSASSQWRSLIQQLNGQVHLIAVDLLGYGQAPVAEQQPHFRLANEVGRIQAALAQLGFSQPVIMVGHSYGGALALKMAADGSVAIKTLALYEPVSFHVLPEDSPGMTEIREVNEAMHGKDARSCTRTFVDYWNQPGYFDALPEKIQALMIGQAGKVALDFDALLGEPLQLEDYAQIQQPVLLMTGEFTRRSAKAVVKALTSVLPKVEKMELAAGHMGPLTHPAEINPVLLNFLQRNS
ncbi:MAG: alpha/beta fold hydrolase [Pseudomonadota bacterium]